LQAAWREDDDMFVLGQPGDDDPTRWQPTWTYETTDNISFPHALQQQVSPGDSPDPTWWLLISTIRRPTAISARLEDDSKVPVHRLGPLLLLEWESVPCTLYVTIDGHTHSLRPFRSPTKGPPTYPWSGHENDIGGWVGFTPIE
jgi:hypothetical protein